MTLLIHFRLFLQEYDQDVPYELTLHAGSKFERLTDRIWAVSFSLALILPEQEAYGVGIGIRVNLVAHTLSECQCSWDHPTMVKRLVGESRFIHYTCPKYVFQYTRPSE